MGYASRNGIQGYFEHPYLNPVLGCKAQYGRVQSPVVGCYPRQKKETPLGVKRSDFRNTGNLEFQTSGIPEIPKSGIPVFRKSGNFVLSDASALLMRQPAWF